MRHARRRTGAVPTTERITKHHGGVFCPPTSLATKRLATEVASNIIRDPATFLRSKWEKRNNSTANGRKTSEKSL
jgi:hypothetical protein